MFNPKDEITGFLPPMRSEFRQVDPLPKPMTDEVREALKHIEFKYLFGRGANTTIVELTDIQLIGLRFSLLTAVSQPEDYEWDVIAALQSVEDEMKRRGLPFID